MTQYFRTQRCFQSNISQKSVFASGFETKFNFKILKGIKVLLLCQHELLIITAIQGYVYVAGFYTLNVDCMYDLININ